ncbi:amino acid ABC transporter permease [Bosea sp. (in: a-proteobacteria)]|uniref:amino acid ABC transporter permease n=1 Tax=Bosea sp. (in: a-proteobacteria) TaxID=1871050 RepID=UPI0026110ADE|nr:amino acid ABC transporter permease [Bosea sp. (in: a-proteobacteria)]MCO5092143.1 amino acid ABC transporter permease [Bosea sp. (in: a-proteobacteria)]
MFFDWSVIFRYWPNLLQGLFATAWITLLVFVLGSIIGLLVAAINVSGSRSGLIIGRLYVNVFRNIPEMVLIFWSYYCLPQITNLGLSALFTGILALSLGAGANLGEIFRAGIQSVPRGQYEAALALGLSPLPRWGRVILPQAIKRMVAPIVNYSTEILKHSTLLSTIGIVEVAQVAFSLGGQTYRYLEFFTVIGVAFFIIIFPISVISRNLATREAGST